MADPTHKDPNSSVIRINSDGDKKSDLHELEIEKEKIELKRDIKKYYSDIPGLLRYDPEMQRNLLELLMKADSNISVGECSFEKIIQSRYTIAKVKVELERARSSKYQLMIVAGIIYLIAILALAVLVSNSFNMDDWSNIEASKLNETLFLGIPITVWVWSVFGSLTSMLFRSWQNPIEDMNEAMRWVITRPIIGVVMGVITYLLVATGLVLVIAPEAAEAGSISSGIKPELIWVIAFTGSFSDTLSVNLLQKVLGKFE